LQAIYVLDDRYQKVQKQTDDRIANEQMQARRGLSDAGALLNQTYKTMSEINTSQVLGIKELFEVTRKANADAADARRDVADAQKERDRIQKLLDGEKKTLADTMIVLSQKSERLDNVKGRIVELTKLSGWRPAKGRRQTG